jgi:hypothetical protein
MQSPCAVSQNSEQCANISIITSAAFLAKFALLTRARLAERADCREEAERLSRLASGDPSRKWASSPSRSTPSSWREEAGPRVVRFAPGPRHPALPPVTAKLGAKIYAVGGALRNHRPKRPPNPAARTTK